MQVQLNPSGFCQAPSPSPLIVIFYTLIWCHVLVSGSFHWLVCPWRMLNNKIVPKTDKLVWSALNERVNEWGCIPAWGWLWHELISSPFSTNIPLQRVIACCWKVCSAFTHACVHVSVTQTHHEPLGRFSWNFQKWGGCYTFLKEYKTL